MSVTPSQRSPRISRVMVESAPALRMRTCLAKALFGAVIPPEGERLYYLFCLPGLAMSTTGATSGRPVSFAAPFRQAAFAVIWTATLISNVGGWMYSAASGWLMTSLNPDPFIVALVREADTLPSFSCSPAPIGRCYHWSPASRSPAVQRSTACCSASSGRAPWAAHSSCRG